MLISWGGEGIYFSSGTAALQPLLATLGTPTIVVTALPLLPGRDRMRWFPPLPHLLLAVRRGLPASADLLHNAPVPPGAIVDLWQPGDPDYDRHPQLPADRRRDSVSGRETALATEALSRRAAASPAQALPGTLRAPQGAAAQLG